MTSCLATPALHQVVNKQLLSEKVLRYIELASNNYQRLSQTAHASETPSRSSADVLTAQPAKKPRTSTLFDEYTESDDESRRQSGASRTSHSLTLQINKYLGMDYDYSEDSLAFWDRNKGGLDKLFVPAITALSIPASSAPVERIFSYSGIFMRPHRSRLSDKNLSALTYLKCNNKNF
jgi:hypothetical protein